MENLHLLLGEILLLFILVALSAFFSGSETAMFSLSRARLLAFRDSDHATERIIYNLMSRYHYTLILLILGNMCVNVGISMVNDDVIRMVTPNQMVAEILSVIIGVVLLLALGEVTPKTIALMHAESLSHLVAGPVWLLQKLTMPFIRLVDRFCRVVLDLLGRRKSEPLSAEEYSTYLEMASMGGVFNETEKKLMLSALMLGSKSAGEVMTPRIDVATVSRTASAETVAKLIREEKRHFFPVVTMDIDDADFLLSAKDFFMLTPEERRNWATSAAVKPSLFIPEQVMLPRVLENLSRQGLSAALITDEYGRVTGMLTSEDIFSEMVGDIEDEHDEPDYSFRRTGLEAWEFDGMIPIYFFEEITGWKLPEDLPVNTVNGLFSEQLGRLPVTDDRIEVGGITFLVKQIDRRRVESFLAEKLPEPLDDENDSNEEDWR